MRKTPEKTILRVAVNKRKLPDSDAEYAEVLAWVRQQDTEAEREACAKTLERLDGLGWDLTAADRYVLKAGAAAIRARGRAVQGEWVINDPEGDDE